MENVLLFCMARDFGIISPKISVRTKGSPTLRYHPLNSLKISEAIFCIRMFNMILNISIVTNKSLGLDSSRATFCFLVSEEVRKDLICIGDSENIVVSLPEKKAEHAVNSTSSEISIIISIG